MLYINYIFLTTKYIHNFVLNLKKKKGKYKIIKFENWIEPQKSSNKNNK